jgi:ribosome-binding protein aMBF1 (putative translation factor)
MMIKNERQYRITKSQMGKFEQALADMEHVGLPEGVHPLLYKTQVEAMRSQRDSLRQELAEYEALRDGGMRTFPPGSFDELPRTLIKARIAAGLSQRELAERLGLKEQQVQKYEATEYTSASLARIRAVIRALGVTVREEVSPAR